MLIVATMNYTRMRMLAMTAKARTSRNSSSLSRSLASTLCKRKNPLRILPIQPAWLHTKSSLAVPNDNITNINCAPL
jgi:hypothetical protein